MPDIDYIDWSKFGFHPRRCNTKGLLDANYEQGTPYVMWTKSVRYKPWRSSDYYSIISCRIWAVDNQSNPLPDAILGKYYVEIHDFSENPWQDHVSDHARVHYIPDQDEAADFLSDWPKLLKGENYEDPDPPERGGFRNAQEYKKWLEDNGISEYAARCVRWPSVDQKDWDEREVPSTEGSGEFYLKLEYLGNKHYISPHDSDKLAQWLKLTEELFS